MRTTGRDPFDLLHEQLVEAAATGAPAATHRRRRSPWWRGFVGRPLVVAATLALGGSATAAAVLTLRGERSAPLEGRMPAVGGRSDGDAARAYRVVLRPDLRVGAAGWCATVRLRSANGDTGGGTGCGPALEASSPQVAGGGIAVAPTRVLDFRILDARVAVVRLADGRRIVPRTDPALPSGWRATVDFLPVRNGRVSDATLGATLLDAGGHVIPLPRSPRGVATLAATKVDPRDPPPRPCAIEHGALPHLVAREQRVVRERLTARVDAAGRPFRTCAAALFSLDGARLRAAVLVDARDPSGSAPALPGGYGAASRRIAQGRAWLVVDGGTPTLRGRLLDALSAHPPGR